MRDVIGADDEDEEGEDLFGPGVEEYVRPFLLLLKTRLLTGDIFSATMRQMNCLTRTPSQD